MDQTFESCRNRWSAANITKINSSRNTWFIFQTNFDQWAIDEDGRR